MGNHLKLHQWKTYNTIMRTKKMVKEYLKNNMETHTIYNEYNLSRLQGTNDRHPHLFNGNTINN